MVITPVEGLFDRESRYAKYAIRFDVHRLPRGETRRKVPVGASTLVSGGGGG